MMRHISGHENLLMTVIKGDFKEHVGRERPKSEYMTQLMEDMNKGKYKDSKELSYNRETWKSATNERRINREKQKYSISIKFIGCLCLDKGYEYFYIIVVCTTLL